jgi:hypothetical protein
MHPGSNRPAQAATYLIRSLVHQMSTDPGQTNRSESNPPTLPTQRNRQLDPRESASSHRIPLPRSDPARREPKQWRIPDASKQKKTYADRKQQSTPGDLRARRKLPDGPCRRLGWWRRGRARRGVAHREGVDVVVVEAVAAPPRHGAQPGSSSDGGGGSGSGTWWRPSGGASLAARLDLRCFLLVRGKGTVVATREVVDDRWGCRVGPGMRDANLAVRCGAVLVPWWCGVPFGREQTGVAGYLLLRGCPHAICIGFCLGFGSPSFKNNFDP